jgi:predicted DNA binding CopG/RHH family protein
MPLPKFDSIREEQAFYEALDVSDALENAPETVFEFEAPAPAPRDELFKVRLSREERMRLEAAAARRGVPCSVIVRDFLRTLPPSQG